MVLKPMPLKVNAPGGRAYTVSWLGLPDVSYPTVPMTTRSSLTGQKN